MEMIQILKYTFQRKSIVNKTNLGRKLLNLKLTATLEEYFAQLENVIREDHLKKT